MLASYVLSRTLVPTLASTADGRRGNAGLALRRRSRAPAFPARLRAALRARARGYHDLLSALARGRPSSSVFWRASLLSFGLSRSSGGISFPRWTPAQIKLHVRAPTGTRVEDTARLFDLLEAAMRQIIPAQQIGSIVDNIGLPCQQHQHHLQQLGHGRQRGCRHPDLAQARLRRPRSTSSPARQAAARVPGHQLRVPARRHRQPDPEFRHAGADRHPDHRPEPEGEPRLANELLEAAPHSWLRRSPESRKRSICRSSGVNIDRSRAAMVHYPARCGQQPADHSLRQQPDRALLLAESGKRPAVPLGGADPAVPDDIAG